MPKTRPNFNRAIPPAFAKMKTKNVWKKIASVCREGKHFYRCESLELTIQQSFLTGRWVIYGKSEKDFATAREAINYAKHLTFCQK